MDDDIRSDPVSVEITELLVATAEGADPEIDEVIPKVLRKLREATHLDVVFVGQFKDGQRVFQYVDMEGDPPMITPGMGEPVEQSWCERVVDGRLPQYVPDRYALPPEADVPATRVPIGTHLSAPIVLSDGRVYGTLCCFSYGVTTTITERDMRRLRFTAELAAHHLEKQQA